MTRGAGGVVHLGVRFVWQQGSPLPPDRSWDKRESPEVKTCAVCLVDGWVWFSACLPACLSVLSVSESGFLSASMTVCLVRGWIWFVACLPVCLVCQ